MLGFQDLDKILRGETGGLVVEVKLRRIAVANLLLAAGYGLCMGFFGLFARGEDWEYRQAVACMVKVPALFALSLAVTFPSLYVFNTLLGSKLRIQELLRLMGAAAGILLAVLAGFGPIVAFFSVTTISYPFAVLMNVAAFAVAAMFGISHLFRMIDLFNKAVERAAREALVEEFSPDETVTPVMAKPKLKHADKASESKAIFYLWTVLFGLVGAQMSWILRPFIGSPNLPFEWFRPRTGSFFESVGRALRMVFGA